jgi:aminoglycoside phosphotransferase (APT) family kinase protein
MDSLDEQEKLEKDLFGPLLNISEDSLVALASRALKKSSDRSSPPTGSVISRDCGSYNLVYVLELDGAVKYVVRIPVIGWGNRFTEAAKQAFTSQVFTMRFIRKETTIPIPEVYAFDTTVANEIGAPYILMSFIPGFTVGSLWFDQTGPTPLEERRLRTLDSVAKAMAQLQKFRFDKIGALQSHPGPSADIATVGPCFRWDENVVNDDNGREVNIQVDEFGPFETSKSYLRHCLDHHVKKYDTPSPRGCRTLVEMMIEHLPTTKNSAKETFVLSLPDFDAQNIMIDEQGNLTGIIDWDNVQTMPRFLGYSSFPGWITRDWDPMMYYPELTDRENSPEELKRYRARYKDTMGKMLRGGGDSIFTGKSHIFEAVAIASMSEMCQLGIVRKIVDRIFPADDEYASVEFISDVGEKKLNPKQKKKLALKFQALLSLPRYFM